LPDSFRARVNSVIASVAEGMMPIGIAAAGFLIDKAGVSTVLMGCGILFMMLAPLLFLTPDFKRFYRLPPKEAEKFFIERYPEAFSKTI